MVGLSLAGMSLDVPLLIRLSGEEQSSMKDIMWEVFPSCGCCARAVVSMVTPRAQ